MVTRKITPSIRKLKEVFGETNKRVEYLEQVRADIESKILEQEEKDPQAIKIGRERERKVSQALSELMQEGTIKGYLPMAPLSYQDLIEGYDFIAVCLADHKYSFFPLSVTGYFWVKTHQRRHPEVPVVFVTWDDDIGVIKNKIVDLIKDQQVGRLNNIK